MYNYNGDNMNRENVIITIKNMNDIKKLEEPSIKYINIDISKIDKEVISYLKNNGKKYLYAESINNKKGYIYVDYDTFLAGEKIIDNIITNYIKFSTLHIIIFNISYHGKQKIVFASSYFFNKMTDKYIFTICFCYNSLFKRFVVNNLFIDSVGSFF